MTGNYTWLKYVRFRSPFLYLALIALVYVGPLSWAQDGLGGALLVSAGARVFSHGAWGERLVAADFDHDQRPDGAVLLNAGVLQGRRLFRIRLHVTAGQDRDLTFESNETAVALATADVNRDGIPDLVVEQVFTRKRLHVWLNDGHGEFRPARVEDYPPSTDAPCNWRLPLERQAGLDLALPSRAGNDHVIQILEALSTRSSSSNWRLRSRPGHVQAASSSFSFPRSPPVFFLL